MNLMDRNDELTAEVRGVVDQIFDRFDNDRDGCLSMVELQSFGIFINEVIYTDRQLNYIRASCEMNGERLTRRGFRQMYHIQAIADPRRTIRDFAKLGLSFRETHRLPAKRMNVVAANFRNFIRYDYLYQNSQFKPRADEIIDAIFTRFDCDNDSCLSYIELRAYLLFTYENAAAVQLNIFRTRFDINNTFRLTRNNFKAVLLQKTVDDPSETYSIFKKHGF